jgi:hypothetical protein
VRVETSILKSTKKILGLAEDYEAFDLDVITHINASFSTLSQLGVGPDVGFAIEDATSEWTDFIDAGPQLNQVKTFVYLKTRMLFDPPTTSYLIGAFEKQLEEVTWRINTLREGTEWTDPSPVTT